MGKLPEPVRILLRKCRALPFVLAFLAFVNIFLPLLGFWNAHYMVKYAAQPHLAALIFSIAFASCFAIPFGIMRSAPRRLFAASASIILGLIVFHWASPERRLQRLLSMTKEVRVYTASFGERQHLVARITDQRSIADLRDSLKLETRPWELLFWFIPGSDHQLEFYGDRGSRIGDFGTIGGGLGITERFLVGSRGYSWKGHIPSWSDYATSSEFQRTYQHVLLSHFVKDAPVLSKRARWSILYSIQSEEAFAEIAADRNTPDPADRVVVARWLARPHKVCVPALIEMASDPIPEVRAQAIISLMAHDEDPRALALLTELRAHPTGDHEVDEYLQRFFERHEGSQRR